MSAANPSPSITTDTRKTWATSVVYNLTRFDSVYRLFSGFWVNNEFPSPWRQSHFPGLTRLNPRHGSRRRISKARDHWPVVGKKSWQMENMVSLSAVQVLWQSSMEVFIFFFICKNWISKLLWVIYYTLLQVWVKWKLFGCVFVMLCTAIVEVVVQFSWIHVHVC